VSAVAATRSPVPSAQALLADVLGDSAVLSSLRRRVGRLLQRQAGSERLPPILIEGETGTGKGLLARSIHRAGPRADGPFVDVNCAAVPEGLLEAEMFGFERGAFPDAHQAKPGLFQAAHRGTIFLDEIGLMPEALQAKLLKVLEERAVRRLGSARSEPVDVVIVAATSEDLGRRVRERRFREDLYHRLAVLTVALPPLRQRGRDVLLLAEHFLARACVEFGLGSKTLSADARAALAAYAWPGNVRELANLMERVALLTEAEEVTAALLDLPAAAPSSPATPPTLDDAKRGHLAEVLARTGWNVSRAASVLGISRNTLRARIDRHGLRPSRRGRGPQAALPASSQASAGVSAPPPATVRWDRRPIALLRIRACGQDGVAASEAARALETAIDKVHAFGGRVAGLSASGLVGAFGIDRSADAVWRAANAALAVQNAAGRARVQLRLGIHAGTLMVGRSGSTIEIDEDAKRGALLELEGLLDAVGPDVILVNAAAAPFLDRRFELVAIAHESGAFRAAKRAGGGVRAGASSAERARPALRERA